MTIANLTLRPSARVGGSPSVQRTGHTINCLTEISVHSRFVKRWLREHPDMYVAGALGGCEQEQELCENIFGAMCSALMQPVRPAIFTRLLRCRGWYMAGTAPQ
jgi:hypothetical protein